MICHPASNSNRFTVSPAKPILCNSILVQDSSARLSVLLYCSTAKGTGNLIASNDNQWTGNDQGCV